MAGISSVAPANRTAYGILNYHNTVEEFDQNAYNDAIISAARFLTRIFPHARYGGQYSSGTTFWSLNVEVSEGEIERTSFYVAVERGEHVIK